MKSSGPGEERCPAGTEALGGLAETADALYPAGPGLGEWGWRGVWPGLDRGWKGGGVWPVLSPEPKRGQGACAGSRGGPPCQSRPAGLQYWGGLVKQVRPRPSPPDLRSVPAGRAELRLAGPADWQGWAGWVSTEARELEHPGAGGGAELARAHSCPARRLLGPFCCAPPGWSYGNFPATWRPRDPTTS